MEESEIIKKILKKKPDPFYKAKNVGCESEVDLNLKKKARKKHQAEKFLSNSAIEKERKRKELKAKRLLWKSLSSEDKVKILALRTKLWKDRPYTDKLKYLISQGIENPENFLS